MAKKAQKKTVAKKPAVKKPAKKTAKAPKKKVNALRPGGRRFEDYNEGLCVYLHDEGHAETLRKLIAKKGDEGNTFYDNLSLPAFAKAVRADGLAASYELFQDDEVYVEVIVGPPLTKHELAASRWFPPQQVRLDLPTGACGSTLPTPCHSIPRRTKTKARWSKFRPAITSCRSIESTGTRAAGRA